MTKRHGTLRWMALGLLLAVLVSSFPLAALADGSHTLRAVEITPDNRAYNWVKSQKTTYTYDFTSTEITDYSQDEVLATASLRTNMIFDGQTLSCKEGKTFSFGSALFLGDDYGLYGGEMSVKANVTGGKLSIGVRLSRTATDTDRRGIWFTMDGTDTVKVTEPESRLTATVKVGKPASVGTLTVKDKADVIELYLDDVLLCSVTYDVYTGALAVLDAAGTSIAAKDTSDVRPAGYFTLFADSMVGTLDDLTFEHNDLTMEKPDVKGFSIDYTTWVATDDRDRTTPTGIDVREGKEVGLFYFLNRGGEDTEFIQDNTKIFLEQGLEGLNEHLTAPGQSGSYFWAEPYFGYYKSMDQWVFRKHAYQLEAAGVDFIFLDFTNGAYYPQELQTLLDTWLELRREGTDTPDICVFSAGTYGAVMGALRGFMYSEEGFAKYGELFYQYKGKPLTLCGARTDTSELGNWINETFTVRDCWAWKDEDGGWNFLQEYTRRGNTIRYILGGPGRDIDGNFEQLALCMGHHPTTSKGRSYEDTRFPTITDNDYGFSLDSGAGLGFAFQFEAVMHFDPDMVMITGWNEWTAGLNQTSSGYEKFAGSADLGFQFVDQFNTEYSRDGEPMKLRQGEESVGYGDNYYYQMTGYIRQYKGTGAVTQASGQASIDLTDNAAWANVGPVYGDNVGDTAWRHEDGYFTNLNYVNNSGRNDLVEAKVSQDADYLYFTVTTAEDVMIDDGANWMNLYVDLDNNPATGWEGFDLALNRARDGHYVSVESLKDGWAGSHIGQALYTVEGNRMVIRLAKATVGLKGQVSTLCFKWADNSTLSGNVMEFMDLGDTAPNDRFSYLYVCPEGEGTAAVSVPAYELLATDGSKVESRDESKPLPGFGSGNQPADTDAPDTNAPDRPDTDGESPDTPNQTVVWKYSTRLKVMIVLTGTVVGLSLYAAIVIPFFVKKKRASR
ncbi:MAG: hypothetical protein J6K29_07920 [Clostridia bacterium]|nr:hypothetical protein [Clostridia bacterium]